MNNPDKLLEQWLAGGALTFNDEQPEDIWEPGFEAGRRIVVAQLGPYFKLYKRPEKFVKRFYHRVFELPVFDWKLSHEVSLYGGFCKIDAVVDIRLQATYKYAKANVDVLADVNRHITANFESLIYDLIDNELHRLNDGEWIKTGLQQVEKNLNTAINELMLLKNIQCRALSTLQPEFADPESQVALDAKFVHESIYINVVQKNFEFKEKQQHELLRQQQEEEKIALQQLNLEEELERKRQSQEAENERLRLLEKEQQQNEQHKIEKRMHTESTRHVIQLRELAAEAELQAEEDQLLRKQKMEQKLLSQKMAHENRIKEKKLLDEIREAEKRELQWNKSKQRLHDEKLDLEKQLKQKELEMELDVEEMRRIEELKRQERLERERLQMDNRMKDLQLEADVTEQKKRFDATNRSADYLRREIELLVLERQRAELNLAIKKAKQEDEELE